MDISGKCVVHKVAIYENGGVNISAYAPAGKDSKGEWRVSPWFNLRPSRDLAEFAKTLQPKDKIEIRGFVGAYKTKPQGNEQPQEKQYIVVQELRLISENTQPAATYGDDNDLPF